MPGTPPALSIKTSTQSVASSNYVPRMLFEVVRKMAYGPDAMVGGQRRAHSDVDLTRQEAMTSIFMGVNTVEAFINIYFRVFAERCGDISKAHTIKTDLQQRKSILHKIKEWPQLCHGVYLDESSVTFKEFDKIRKLRNQIMHFQSSYEDLTYDSVIMNSLTDISFIETLDWNMPKKVMYAVTDFVGLILQNSGLDQVETAKASRYWIGFG